MDNIYSLGGQKWRRWIAYWINTLNAGVIDINSNKQNSLAVDGTGVKYPTVDAINVTSLCAILGTVIATSDGNAQMSGVGLGEVYYNATTENLKTLQALLNTPTLESVGTSVDGTKVILTFDMDMATPPGLFNFTVKVFDAELEEYVTNIVTLAALGVDTKTIELTVTTPFTVSDIGVASVSSNVLSSVDTNFAGVVDTPITNNIPT